MSANRSSCGKSCESRASGIFNRVQFFIWFVLVEVLCGVVLEAEVCAAQYSVRQVSKIVFSLDAPILENPQIVAGRLFFVARSANGRELFATDGDSLIEYDISPGPSGSLPTEFYEWDNQLFFRARGPLGEELYSIKDSAPTLVADIFTGSGDASPRAHDKFPEIAGQRYFFARDTSGRALYRTSGNNAEYVAPAETTHTPGFAILNSELIFVGQGTTGTELYRTDGTAVSLLADINPGSANSDPYPFFESELGLFFSAEGPNGRELFRTNGVSLQEFDVHPGPGSSSPVPRVVFKNELYFSAIRDNGYELFKTNGTDVTEFDVNPGLQGSSALAGYFGMTADYLYFVANGPQGRELFRTDGTSVTDLDLNPGSASSDPLFFKTIGDAIYLKATGPMGTELYKVTNDEVKLIDLNPGTALSNPQTQHMVEHNGAIYIEAVGPHGVELFKIVDDIPTEIDLPSNARGSYPEEFMKFNGELFFSAAGTNGRAIYYTDGNLITELANLRPLSGAAVPDRIVSSFVQFGNSLYFISATPTGGHLFQISVVPEPGTMVGMLGAMLLMVPRRRRA